MVALVSSVATRRVVLEARDMDPIHQLNRAKRPEKVTKVCRGLIVLTHTQQSQVSNQIGHALTHASAKSYTVNVCPMIQHGSDMEFDDTIMFGLEFRL